MQKNIRREEMKREEILLILDKKDCVAGGFEYVIETEFYEIDITTRSDDIRKIKRDRERMIIKKVWNDETEQN
jgi:hypothetical protein